MVMPETGDGAAADDAYDSGGDGDEEESEDDDEEGGGEVGECADLRSGDGFELEEEEHEEDEEEGAAEDDGRGEIVLDAGGCGVVMRRLLFADLFEALGEGAEDGGERCGGG